MMQAGAKASSSSSSSGEAPAWRSAKWCTSLPATSTRVVTRTQLPKMMSEVAHWGSCPAAPPICNSIAQCHTWALEVLLDGDSISACMCRTDDVIDGDQCGTGRSDDCSWPHPGFCCTKCCTNCCTNCCTKLCKLKSAVSKDTGRRTGWPQMQSAASELHNLFCKCLCMKQLANIMLVTTLTIQI